MALHLAGEKSPRGCHLENMILCDLLAWQGSSEGQQLFCWRSRQRSNPASRMQATCSHSARSTSGLLCRPCWCMQATKSAGLPRGYSPCPGGSSFEAWCHTPVSAHRQNTSSLRSHKRVSIQIHPVVNQPECVPFELKPFVNRKEVVAEK